MTRERRSPSSKPPALTRVPTRVRFLYAVIGAWVLLGASMAPAHAAPTLALSVNQATFRSGDTLHIGLTARNPGPAFNADFYFGVLLPDGLSVVFLTSLAPLNGAGTRLDANPNTFKPLVTNLLIPQPLDVTLPDILVFTFTQGLPPATYVFFVLTSTGLTFVVSLATVFNFEQFYPIAKRCIWLAISTLTLQVGCAAQKNEPPTAKYSGS